MKIHSIVSRALLSVAFMLGLIGPISVSAATAPSLGAADSFSVLAGLSTAANGGGTTVSGNLGLSPGLAVSRTGTWTVLGTEYFGTGGLSQTAQTDALSAFNNLAGQTTSGGWGSSPWSPIPGVWTVALDTTFTGTITLDGGFDDVWVFQVGQDMTFTGSVVLAGNAQACHVFWQVGRDATIGSGSNFVGTLIASRDITFASGANVNGRAISLTSSLVLNGTPTTISGPTCNSAPATVVGGSSPGRGTVNVVKVVINDNNGTKTISDFPLFVNGTLVGSGQTNNFPAPAGLYSVTEVTSSGYTRSFSGDCDANGQFGLYKGGNIFCIITNNDIGSPLVPVVPPLIDVVKVPNPLALPNGPGNVTYTYTVRNIGTVPMTDVTMVGDTCAPVSLISGDTNNDGRLDVNETWIYTCTTQLSETHTNTVVATGWANGISAVDIASANVVVGQSIVPPLIHVTKVPNPLALDAGGGMVTYTDEVTNPGLVPLTNVRLTDNKCSPVKYISGDTDGNLMLDPSETWTFSCQSRLTRTTVNTVIARGEANGLTIRDFAIATVVVAVPKVPNTGVGSSANILWEISTGILLAGSGLFFVIRRKKSL
ncbi:MAG TPA: ice-binding family protein [Candidatus Udaeobacter sp.]|nr:ice-binding family protein [Candidatus Udaeobacter sp.]